MNLKSLICHVFFIIKSYHYIVNYVYSTINTYDVNKLHIKIN